MLYHSTSLSRRFAFCLATASADLRIPEVQQQRQGRRVQARDEDWRLLHLCSGSLADIGQPIRHVRFAPKSGHVQRRSRCLLCANNGHLAREFIRYLAASSERSLYASRGARRASAQSKRSVSGGGPSVAPLCSACPPLFEHLRYLWLNRWR